MIFKKKDDKFKKELLLNLRKLYYELTANHDIEISEKTRLNNTIGLSSLGKIQFICLIEENFDIEIPNRVIHSIKTINDLINCIIKYSSNKR